MSPAPARPAPPFLDSCPCVRMTVVPRVSFCGQFRSRIPLDRNLSCPLVACLPDFFGMRCSSSHLWASDQHSNHRKSNSPRLPRVCATGAKLQSVSYRRQTERPCQNWVAPPPGPQSWIRWRYPYLLMRSSKYHRRESHVQNQRPPCMSCSAKMQRHVNPCVQRAIVFAQRISWYFLLVT